LGLLPLDARVDAEMDQTVRVVFGGHCDVWILFEAREPDAGALGLEAEVVALEDTEADGLRFLNEGINGVVSVGSLSLR
jgi:hypothetical protein